MRLLLLFGLLLGLGYRAAGQVVPLSKRVVPLDSVQVAGAHLRPRVLGSLSDSRTVFFMTDYNAPGTQVGQALHLARPGWLQSVSFHLAACSFDSLLLRVHVYGTEQGFPGAELLPAAVAVRLGRRDLRSRVVLNLRSYHLWLSGDVVVALELLRPTGPGTLMWSAERVPGTLYKLEPIGTATAHNLPPAGQRIRDVPWQRSLSSPWSRWGPYSLGISATVLQEAR